MSIQDIRDKELNLFKDGMWDTLFEIEKLSHEYAGDDKETAEELWVHLKSIEEISKAARLSLGVMTMDSIDEVQ